MLPPSIPFPNGVSATQCPFCCWIFSGSADKGLKKDSETKGMWGLFATKGVDSPGTEEVALNLESLITPVHP